MVGIAGYKNQFASGDFKLFITKLHLPLTFQYHHLFAVFKVFVGLYLLFDDNTKSIAEAIAI